ncbi:hypothetical protein MTR_7g077640 [Medicago truncatula]|uniref:GRF-type domain-containing protein n=1 Tax=Medicago truncatula TaxID=3880 RepID=G7L4M8_MEDTR|nr:hypothetical protein MTR_7g077640 [Medicago truncatula]
MSSAGSRFNRRNNNECGRAMSGSCGEFVVLKTITEITNPNCGKKFWGCRNWRNRNDSGCNYFQFVVDDDDKCDDVDERDMKIARQKKKNGKLKHEVSFLKEELCNSRRCCKIAIYAHT